MKPMGTRDRNEHVCRRNDPSEPRKCIVLLAYCIVVITLGLAASWSVTRSTTPVPIVTRAEREPASKDASTGAEDAAEILLMFLFGQPAGIAYDVLDDIMIDDEQAYVIRPQPLENERSLLFMILFAVSLVYYAVLFLPLCLLKRGHKSRKMLLTLQIAFLVPHLASILLMGLLML